MRRLTQFAYLLTLGVITFASAEITSRLDDWIASDIPISATPSFRDLVSIGQNDVPQGTPYGRFKSIRLNSFGFRSPEITLAPQHGTTRIMVLGASEILCVGLPEDETVTSRLEQILDKHGPYEVINAAMAGMTARSMLPYWRHWAASFQPQIVVIYPNPLFYLHMSFAREAPPLTHDNIPATPQFAFRFLDRMRDVIDLPDFAQTWRNQQHIAAQMEGISTESVIRGVPADRLHTFTDDLHALIAAIREHDALPVLVTHGIRASTPPIAEDFCDLQAMRVVLPHVTEEAFCWFDRDARQCVLRVACEQDVPVVDIAPHINGRRECFVDLVHFSSLGAEQVAEDLGTLLQSKQIIDEGISQSTAKVQ